MTGGVVRGRLSETEGSDFHCAYGGTANGCDLSLLAVERYWRPKQLGRLLMQGKLVPKLSSLSTEGKRSVNTELPPGGISSWLSQRLHTLEELFTRQTTQGYGAAQPLHIFAHLARFGTLTRPSMLLSR